MSTDTGDRKLKPILETSMHNKTLVFIIMQTYTWNNFKTKKTKLHQTNLFFLVKKKTIFISYYSLILFTEHTVHKHTYPQRFLILVLEQEPAFPHILSPV